ncbi:MAG: DUF3298 domain-containing protein [Bacteroidia bacterium]
MYKKVLPILGILLIFNNSGCNKTTPSEEVLQKDTIVDDLSLCREGVIEYEIETVKELASDPKNRSKIIAEVHIKFPELRCANTKLRTAVNEYITTFIEGNLKDNMNVEDTARAKTITTATRAFIRSCKANIADAKKEDPDMDQVWYCDVIGNVEMQSGNYFTIRFKYNSYTGGAHGNYGEDYATFNINTGKKLVWADLLVDKDKFSKLAELRFKQVNGMETSKKLTEEEGFSFENNKFSLSDNFGLTSDGLVVYYQPYQVAPFSFGATTLQFKYFEISDYLNPGLFGESI